MPASRSAAAVRADRLTSSATLVELHMPNRFCRMATESGVCSARATSRDHTVSVITQLPGMPR